jgi:hypothetical protein
MPSAVQQGRIAAVELKTRPLAISMAANAGVAVPAGARETGLAKNRISVVARERAFESFAMPGLGLPNRRPARQPSFDGDGGVPNLSLTAAHDTSIDIALESDFNAALGFPRQPLNGW